jgi:predicted short-subunit dehydrogenase-like oxidoreductase (DUF2520 family)
MSARRIAIVGVGNLGHALAVSLRSAGYEINSLLVRPPASVATSKKTRKLAKQVGARMTDRPSEIAGANVIWFCVPDSEIKPAAAALSSAIGWKGKVAIHSSGALTSDELSALRRRGASVASVHPLMTFVRGSQPALAGVAFALEGDAAALRVARTIVKKLGGSAYNIRKQEKPAYHAWATFTSPLLTALLATSAQVARAAGVDRNEAKRRMLPILRQTLENYAAYDAAAAFSGPIIRGDVDTVKKHLHTLCKIPAAREVYAALARAALAYLSAKNKAALKRALATK